MAPMEGATDAAFRQIVLSLGKPHVSFTEFTNVEGLTSKGRRLVEQRLLYESSEQPLIAQVWGLVPEHFFKIAGEIVERGFAGIDINMACPDRAVIKKGSGGALILNRKLAALIIQAVKQGVRNKIPVSVKTRIGFKQIETESWVEFLLKQEIDALTVHGRTVSELSKVPAHWDEITKAVAVRNLLGVKTVIIGNGDVTSLAQADDLAKKSGVDGVMIGRGVFKNPWVFGEKANSQGALEINRTKKERLDLLIRHIDLHQKFFDTEKFAKEPGKVWKPFEPLKRYFKIYIQKFPGALKLRDELMHCHSYDEARSCLAKYKR